MESSEERWSGSDGPPELRPILTVKIDMLEERTGGCAVNFTIPDESELIAKYGRRGSALAACRDILVGELDTLVREFADEE